MTSHKEEEGSYKSGTPVLKKEGISNKEEQKELQQNQRKVRSEFRGKRIKIWIWNQTKRQRPERTESGQDNQCLEGQRKRNSSEQAGTGKLSGTSKPFLGPGQRLPSSPSVVVVVGCSSHSFCCIKNIYQKIEQLFFWQSESCLALPTLQSFKEVWRGPLRYNPKQQHLLKPPDLYNSK